jgi:hypothetical protein
MKKEIKDIEKYLKNTELIDIVDNNKKEFLKITFIVEKPIKIPLREEPGAINIFAQIGNLLSENNYKILDSGMEVLNTFDDYKSYETFERKVLEQDENI